MVILQGSMSAVAKKVANATSLLHRQLGRWPTYQEIADHTALSASRVKLVSDRSKHPISINRPAKNQELILEVIFNRI